MNDRIHGMPLDGLQKVRKLGDVSPHHLDPLLHFGIEGQFSSAIVVIADNVQPLLYQDFCQVKPDQTIYPCNKDRHSISPFMHAPRISYKKDF